LSVYINQITTALPINEYQVEEIGSFLARTAKSSASGRKAKIVAAKSGIKTRHSVLADFRTDAPKALFKPAIPAVEDRLDQYNLHALPLALKAIEQLSEFDPSAITHIITVSCTGMTAPGLELRLTEALKLKSSSAKHAVNFLGCHGVFHALKMAKSIVEADPSAEALIVSVELCSLHFQPTDDDDSILANVLFGDGAAAALVSGSNKNQRSIELDNFDQEFIPSDDKMMAWNIHSSGFLLKLSSYVPQAIEQGVSDLFNKASRSSNDLWAIHPGGKNILDAVEDAMKLTPEQMKASRNVLRDNGNMSSATILFVLKKLLYESERSAPLYGLGFGPGLTIEKLTGKVHV